MKYYKAIILPMGQRIVSVIDTKHNQSYALPNWEKDRPADFNWGYGGTGVLDLARSILVDLLDINLEDFEDTRAFYLKENLISILDQNKGWTLSQEEIEGAAQLADREPDYDN